MDSNRNAARSKREEQSRKRPAEDDSDVQQNAKRPRHDVAALCTRCDQIDFMSYFTSSPKIRALGRLKLFFQDQSCPFCLYIQGIATVKLGDFDHLVNRGYTLRASRRLLSPEQYLRTANLLKAQRLILEAQPAKGEPVTLSSLELCQSFTPSKSSNARWQMVRRPIERSFNSELLRNWLGDDKAFNKGRRGQNQARTRTLEALERLMDDAKFRVIDVYSGDVVVLRTLERYVALSYVWGRSMTHYAATVTQAFVDCIEPATAEECVGSTSSIPQMPPTIRDAATLVKQIGERYLWVDSFCIRQNDAQDKALIISNMDAIYSQAYLTIVAASGEDADAGLGRLKAHKSYPEIPLKLTQEGTTLSLLPSKPDLEQVLKHTKWNTRAWTYQERLLSGKTVFFTDHEVFFTNREGSQREAYGLEMRNWQRSAERPSAEATSIETSTAQRTTGKTGRPLSTHDVFMRGGRIAHQDADYQNAVHAYSKRSLTHPGDRLDAFMGVLKFMFPKYAEACSGLPDSNYGIGFARSLLSTFTGSLDKPFVRIRRNATNTRALPSWSWAGWTGGSPREPHSLATVLLLPLHIKILDDTNIQCIHVKRSSHDDERKQWPSAPSPSKLTVTEGIVLHLWVQVLECYLSLPPQFWRGYESASASYQYDIDLVRPTLPRPPFQGISSIVLPSPSMSGVHKFLVFADEKEQFCLMMIERHADYCERVGLSDWTRNWQGGTEWIKVINELPYQHIKLI